jgi:hypothetical protein
MPSRAQTVSVAGGCGIRPVFRIVRRGERRLRRRGERRRSVSGRSAPR